MFTEKEPTEIKNDNIKKIMVLSKLYQKHQIEIKKCIELTTTQEQINNYDDFERKLNQKLNKKQL